MSKINELMKKHCSFLLKSKAHWPFVTGPIINKNSFEGFKKRPFTAFLMLGKILMVDVQCLYSVASEVIPGNAARMCEFPW